MKTVDTPIVNLEDVLKMMKDILFSRCHINSGWENGPWRGKLDVFALDDDEGGEERFITAEIGYGPGRGTYFEISRFDRKTAIARLQSRLWGNESPMRERKHQLACHRIQNILTEVPQTPWRLPQDKDFAISEIDWRVFQGWVALSQRLDAELDGDASDGLRTLCRRVQAKVDELNQQLLAASEVIARAGGMLR